MRHIDLEVWPRREHFRTYRDLDYPYFSMCANVDLTTFHTVLKQGGVSFNVAMVYVLARAANDVPEFRHRIRGESVVEHEIVHPSTTIMGEEELFGFYALEYFEDFSLFLARAGERIAQVQQNPKLENEPGRDDLLFMTAIPWVSFTSFMHPLPLHPADSVPRFAWGRFFEEGERLKMPLSVQGHHGVMDGLHMGRFYAEVQEYFDHPHFVPSEV